MTIPQCISPSSLTPLSPYDRVECVGTIVTVQFDNCSPATGRFRGFQGGAVPLPSFDGFPG
jgi:hypothetical protein